MKTRLLYRNFLVILGIDVLLLAVAWYGAHLLRFNFEIPVGHLSVMLKAFPVIIVVKIVTFYFFDLYRGMWRYTSIADLLNIIKASGISSLISSALFSLVQDLKVFRVLFLLLIGV